MSIAKILGRAWFYDVDPTELELWEHEFEPMLTGRSGVDWCKEHLLEGVTENNLRELLEVPEEGNFQVMFKGTMSSWKTSSIDWGEEWDEEFTLEESKVMPIPEEYMHFRSLKDSQS